MTEKITVEETIDSFENGGFIGLLKIEGKTKYISVQFDEDYVVDHEKLMILFESMGHQLSVVTGAYDEYIEDIKKEAEEKN